MTKFSDFYALNDFWNKNVNDAAPCSVLCLFVFLAVSEIKCIHVHLQQLGLHYCNEWGKYTRNDKENNQIWWMSTYNNFRKCHIFSLLMCNVILAQNFKYQKFAHLDYLDICLWESPNENKLLREAFFPINIINTSF